jgi:hypothetical protein
MRSFFIILGTAAALMCAFAMYVHLSAPPGREADPADGAAPIPVANADGQTYMTGAWSNLYDKDGQLYGRLRSAKCVPEADGLWHLTEPEAEFFQKDGQIAHMSARDGDVRLGQQTHNESLGNGPIDPPSQGTLNDVTVRLYSDEAAESNGDPEMTLHMDNTRFDADTYRLYTVAADGIAADQIPITIRGRQVDFDGRGLLLEWNGQAHELRSLVISHEQAMTLRQQSPSPTTKPARETSATKKSGSPVHVYLATFEGGVHVTQSGQERISSPVMTVMMATGSSTKQADGNPPVAPSAEKSKTNEQPLTVTWGGEARIVPTTLTPANALAPGQSIIRFWGGEVHVAENGMTMVGTDMSYDNASQSGVAIGSAEKSLVMNFANKDGKNTGTVVTQKARFSQLNKQVVLGPGAGAFANPTSKTGDVMNAAWDQSCNLTLAGSGDRFELQQAALIGNASIHDGPKGAPEKLKLTAQRIDTDFAQQPAPVDPAKAKAGKEPGTEPVLKRLIASTHANCVIHETGRPDRTIGADKLTVEIAQDDADKPYPHFVTAEGNVRAEQDEQVLTARRMDATMVQDTSKGKNNGEPKPQIIVADGDVHLHGKHGETASGDNLTVETHGNDQWMTLIGSPAATVTSDKRTLTGHELRLRPGENWAMVNGAGGVEGLVTAKPGKPDQPIHAKWNTSATVLGNENKVDILGGVEADTTEAAGTKMIVQGDHAILILSAKPSTQPSKATTKKSAPDSSLGGVAFDPFKDKQVQYVTLLQHASLESTLLAADKSILKRQFIEGDEIDSDVVNQHVVVPGAGRMLLEEHRKRNETEKSPVSGQGATAISWAKKFTYDLSAHHAVLDGSVNINHVPDNKASPTSMVADQVVVDFEPLAPGAADSTPPLKQMTATGHILIQILSQSGSKLIEANSVIYDPKTQTLTIKGTPTADVIITDTKTNGQESCEQAIVNVRTNDFQAINVSGNGRR